MADQFDSKNGHLASSSDESTSSAVQNDQVFINNDQASSSSSTAYGNGHQKQTQAVGNHVKSMVGLRQNAVDNPGLSSDTPISSGKVVNGLNQPVEHIPPMVDRRQSTVEDTDGHAIDKRAVDVDTQFTQAGTQLGKDGEVVDRQKRTVEDDPPSAQVNGVQFIVPAITGNMVDRQKRTVEDDTLSDQVTGANGHGVPNTMQFTSMQPTTSEITGSIVDRQKRTVEDEAPSFQVTGANGTQSTGMNPTTTGITGNMVDRQKKTVEDDAPSVQGTGANGTQSTGMEPTTSGINGNMVDRQKKTVEDDAPSVQCGGANSITGNMVDCQKRTVEDDASVQGTSANGHANGTQITGMEPTTLGITGNMVDRQKKTVEDDTSVQGTESNGTQITGIQPTTSEITGNMVGRQKRTVEDDAASVQGRAVNGWQQNQQYGGTELEQQFREGCNTSERKRTNSHPEAAKWKIQLHVNTACHGDIIRHLPKSKFFEWNKSVVFGRRPCVDIFINDERASRDHVEVMGQILPDGQVLFMAKNISRKGYNLNGENITGTDQWIPLKRTDNIRIAGLMCFIDIIPGRDMDGFVIEFKSPEICPSPVVASPVWAIPFPVLPSPTGHLGFFNQYPTASFPPYPNPQPVHPSQSHLPPNNGIPMQSYWSYYGNMQPEQSMHRLYLPGDGDTMQVFQSYQEREACDKLGINLCHLAQDVVEEWKELGRALGLEDWQIHAIHKDFEGIREKSYQMLKTWVRRCPEQATLDNLKKALLDVTVERGDLVEKYCTVDNNGEENDNMSTDNNPDNNESA